MFAIDSKLIGRSTLLLVSILVTAILSSCGSQRMEDKEADGNSLSKRKITLSSLTIDRLNSDLREAGYSETQATAITNGSKEAITRKDLDDSDKIEQVAPVILRGAEVSVAKPEAKLSTSTEKTEAIKIILTSLSNSLKGKLSESSFLSNTWRVVKSGALNLLFSKPSFQSSASYTDVLDTLIDVVIQSLDEAGIEKSSLPASIKAIIHQFVGNLSNSGVGSTKIVGITQSITERAVGSLDEAGVDQGDIGTVVSALVSGVVNGLKKYGFNSVKIANAADDITRGAVRGMIDTGLSEPVIVAAIEFIRTGIVNGLGEAGLTRGQIDSIMSDINTAIIEGKKDIHINNKPVAIAATIYAVEDNSVFITLTGSDPEGNALTYSLKPGSSPSNGTFQLNSPPALYYKPNADFNGTDSFQFRVSDGNLLSEDATIDIIVGPVNDAPHASDSVLDLSEDVPQTIVFDVSDPDTADTLSYSIVESPSFGVISDAAGHKIYTPNSDYFGSDRIRFKVFDGTEYSETATITITISAINDAPEVSGVSVTLNEDTSTPITLFGSDVDSSSVTFTTLTTPSHGSLSGSPPNLTYTPNANYNGGDSFIYKVSDGELDSTADITITVNPGNDPPTATSFSKTVYKNTSSEITLPFTDIDGDSVDCAIVTQPTKGTISQNGDACVVTYSPFSGSTGQDSFTFKVNDGVVDSDIATATLTINNTNSPPQARNLSLSGNEDFDLAITLIGTDDDSGDTLTYSILSPPSHGSLSGTGENRTYDPTTDYSGFDSFTYRVSDGNATDDATVSITLQPINDKPSASDASFDSSEDTDLNITLSGSDVENSSLIYTITLSPSHGTLSNISGDQITYSPNTHYHGADSFKYRVNDGSLNSDNATITLNIISVNDSPVAQSATVGTALDTSVDITLSASDVEGSALTYTTSDVTHGSLSNASGNQITFTPETSYTGTASFHFVANDGSNDSNTATVSIEVGGTNQAPTASACSGDVSEDTGKNLTLDATDDGGGPLSFSIIAQPLHGSLSDISGDQVTYTPNSNYHGSDSFTFKASDATLDSNVATFSLTIHSINDAPVANGATASTTEDISTDITLTGSDVETSSLIYSIVSSPSHGALDGTGDSWTYDPTSDYSGSDSFTFRVSDGDATDDATVTLTITPVNDPPVATGSSIDTTEDTSLNITMNGNDVENDTLAYSIVNSPAKGTLSDVSGDTVTFTPHLNVHGADSFSFNIYDGSAYSSEVTVHLTIASVNDPPQANATSISTDEDTSADLTLTGSDVEGAPLTYIIVTQPARGTLDPSDDTTSDIRYIPNANANGSDSFTFKVNDGSSDSTPATVSITINPVNDAPVANSANIDVSEDLQKQITLTGSDAENEPLTFFRVNTPSHGSLSDVSNDHITYYPNSNFSGTDSFTFKVRDSNGAFSAEATINLTIHAVNDAPIANSASVDATEDTPLSITLTGSDVDSSSDGFAYIIVTQPSKGTLDPSDDTVQTVTYTPNANENGSDSFTFKVRDDQSADSDAVTVSVNIAPVNDCPAISGTPATEATANMAYTSFIPTANDVDAGQTLTFSTTGRPDWLALNTSYGELSGTPSSSDVGTSGAITLSVSDGTCQVSLPSFTITVSEQSNGGRDKKWGSMRWGTGQWTSAE